MYILQIFPPSDPIYYDIWIIYLFSSTTDCILYYVRREWETCCSVSRYAGLDTHLHHLTLTIHINRRTSLIHSQPQPTPTQTYSTRYLKNVDSKMDFSAFACKVWGYSSYFRGICHENGIFFDVNIDVIIKQIYLKHLSL